ncbi:MAG: Asp23/Gls24 family envelope stress response protein [Acidimicrobiia bacterium]
MDRASGLLDAVDVDAVAERAAGCRSVARLFPGAVGEVATYLPGRRVPGVRLAGGQIQVHVVARWGVRVPDLAAEVRAAVAPVSAGFPIAVHVDDLDVPESGDEAEVLLPDTG